MTTGLRTTARSMAGKDGPLRSSAWVPRAAGLLTALTGLINLASALTPEYRSRLHLLARTLPGAIDNVSPAATAATAVSGMLLLLLAHGLRRRKRRAWRAVVVLLLASVVLHVVKGLDFEEALVAALLVVALVVTRREFHAKGDPRTRWRAVGVGLLLLVFSVVLGFLLIDLRLRSASGSHSTAEILREVVLGLIGVRGPLDFSGHPRLANVVHDTLFAFGLLTAVTTAYLALRPAEPAPRLAPEDERRMRELLDRHGRRDSLGYFSLRRDKSVLWSPTGKSAIAYRVLSGVMLTSGDPLGDPEAWPGAIGRFLSEAADHAWVPAVMGCSEQAGAAWVRAGLDALELGDEAIVDVSDFTLEGRAMRNVRQCVVHVEREGYTCRVARVGDLGESDVRRLQETADAWRDGEQERGFSMALSRIGEAGDEACVVVMAEENAALRGFLHFVPWGSDGLSLDLMRRDRGADRGLNEYLIVQALRAAPDLGVTRISLNFAVFRSALERGSRLGAGPVIRAWRGFLLFVSRWFQIESLYRFNAKFRPVWEPRYVCYPTARDIPRIAIAALEAEAFLVWPTTRLSRLLPLRSR